MFFQYLHEPQHQHNQDIPHELHGVCLNAGAVLGALSHGQWIRPSASSGGVVCMAADQGSKWEMQTPALLCFLAHPAYSNHRVEKGRLCFYLVCIYSLPTFRCATCIWCTPHHRSYRRLLYVNIAVTNAATGWDPG